MSSQTKPLSVSLFKRNAIVTLAAIPLLAGVSFIPREYSPHWLFVMFAFFCAVLWANSILIKQNRPIAAVLLTFALVPVLGFPVAILSIPVRRSLLNREYEAQGYQMVEGCDGGAAVGADGEVSYFKQLLEMTTNEPSVDTNTINDLKTGYALAQEKAKALDDYCGRAGHVDLHPWKTNWAEIKEIRKRVEGKLYQ